MVDKVCLVTGGTSGVGKAVALHLAQCGAEVVIAARDADKGAETVDELIRASKNERVYFIAADLSEVESVRRLAAEFKSRFRALHVLSNNAAVLPMNRTVNSRGSEITFAVNYLSHYLLSNLLIDMLKSSAPSRILSVTGNSGIIRTGNINFDDLHGERGFNPFKATLQAAFAKEIYFLSLSDKIKNFGVSSNTFHPGFVKSRLLRNTPVLLRPFISAAMAFLPAKCRPAEFLATDKSIEKTSGKHYENGRMGDFKARNFTGVIVDKLIAESEKLSSSS